MEKKLRLPLTVRVDKELLNTIRTVVYWTPGLTLQSFVEQALENHLAQQKDHEKYRAAVQEYWK